MVPTFSHVNPYVVAIIFMASKTVYILHVMNTSKTIYTLLRIKFGEGLKILK